MRRATSRGRVLLRLGLLLMTGACANEAERAADRDATEAPAHWTVDSLPRLRLTQDDSVSFEGVQGLTVLTDGGVVVASYVANTLRYFDADGTYRRSVGREGKGPGEFRTITAFSRYGDTLAVMDLDDVSQHFTLDGRFVRTDARPLGGGRLLGHFGAGERVLGRFLLDSVRAGTTSHVPDMLVRGRDSLEVSLGVFRSRLLTRDADGRLSAKLYTAENRVAVFDDGFCAGYGGGDTITCHDVNGTVRSTIVLRGRTPVAVTAADRESYFAEFRLANQRVPKAALEAEEARMRERLTFAESLGLFGPLMASRDGLLWVGPPGIDAWRYADPNPLSDAPMTWSVYTRTGIWMADVTLPPRFFLREAGADYVAGVTRDADDAEVVVVYTLRR
jgi:hypothetical protein